VAQGQSKCLCSGKGMFEGESMSITLYVTRRFGKGRVGSGSDRDPALGPGLLPRRGPLRRLGLRVGISITGGPHGRRWT